MQHGGRCLLSTVARLSSTFDSTCRANVSAGRPNAPLTNLMGWRRERSLARKGDGTVVAWGRNYFVARALSVLALFSVTGFGGNGHIRAATGRRHNIAGSFDHC